jgi:hypothetical protein
MTSQTLIVKHPPILGDGIVMLDFAQLLDEMGAVFGKTVDDLHFPAMALGWFVPVALSRFGLFPAQNVAGRCADEVFMPAFAHPLLDYH